MTRRQRIFQANARALSTFGTLALSSMRAVRERHVVTGVALSLATPYLVSRSFLSAIREKPETPEKQSAFVYTMQ